MQLFNCFVAVINMSISNISNERSICLSKVFNDETLIDVDVQSMLLDYEKDSVTFNISFDKIEDRDTFIKKISLVLDNSDYTYSYGIGEFKYA